MLLKNYYDAVETPGLLKHILYSDTDSIFVVIPAKDSEKLTTKEKLVIADKASGCINTAVSKYLTEYFLPKSNITPDRNATYFKSEMLMSAIFFLDIKKQYAYRIEAKKGKIFTKSKIEYKGLQVVKSNTAQLTKDILREIIGSSDSDFEKEGIILNDKLNNKERLSKTSDIVNKYHAKFKEDINNLDLADISIPGKWGKADQYINGMSLYNFIMGKEIFSMGSSGNFIYCIFRNPKLFQKSNLDMEKVKGIVIPRVYDKVLLDKKLNEYQIQIDSDEQWDKLYSTTVGRIVDLVKLTK